MAKTVGLKVRSDVPQGYVLCTSQRCDYTGSAEHHAHPMFEGAFLRLGCGLKINTDTELNWPTKGFVVAMAASGHELLARLQLAHEMHDTASTKLLTLALAYTVDDPFCLVA